MLNRRILRIKAFKTLYSSVFVPGTSLQQAQNQLNDSCEATRELYVFMLGVISPLTKIARERIETAKNKISPTPEELNPNMKFADNAIAKMLDEDADFQKCFNKTMKFSWVSYDVFLRKILNSIVSKQYYADYMASETVSPAEDAKLWSKVFEEEFVDSVELEKILEERSIYWNDDLAYALTYCCTTVKDLARGNHWSLPPLYKSDMSRTPDKESDSAFVRKLFQAGFSNFGKYSNMIGEAVPQWDKERLYSTDIVLIVLGMAEAVAFPEMPLRVTMNEYVEISKFYGTPRSRAFVNGLLNGMIEKLKEEDAIVKSGKGLL